MKKRGVFAVTVLFILSLGVAFLGVQGVKAVECKKGYNFIGNTETKIYHLPTCSAAKKLSEKNATFFKTSKGATKAGYTPCKLCKPDTASTKPSSTKTPEE